MISWLVELENVCNLWRTQYCSPSAKLAFSTLSSYNRSERSLLPLNSQACSIGVSFGREINLMMLPLVWQLRRQWRMCPADGFPLLK